MGQPKSEARVQITGRAQLEVLCSLTLLEGFAPTITKTSIFVLILIVLEGFFCCFFVWDEKML